MKPIVLYVEDEETLRNDVAEELELAGFEAIVAANGRLALDQIRIKQPDLILCDMTMPVMNGYELLLALRSLPRLKQIPFVFITACDDISKLPLPGPSNVYIIFKPFDFEQLIEFVHLKLGQAAERRARSIDESLGIT